MADPCHGRHAPYRAYIGDSAQFVSTVELESARVAPKSREGKWMREIEGMNNEKIIAGLMSIVPHAVIAHHIPGRIRLKISLAESRNELSVVRARIKSMTTE
jgi:hypothetical protein